MRISARHAGVLAACLLSTVAACGGDGPTGDRTAPSVDVSTPAPGATGIERTTTVTATFSERLDPSTVNPTTFTLTPAGGSAVPAIVTLDTEGTVATLAPTENLTFGTSYTARLTTGIEDVAGNALAEQHTWTFTTVANPAPTVVSVTPANGATDVPGLTAITVTFSEPVANVTSSTFTITPAGGTAVEGTIGVDDEVVTFQPASALPFGTTLTARLTTGITDLFGAPLAQAFTWTFTTIENDPPTANAGPAQDVMIGATVTLSGTASDPDGHAITLYRWMQVSGPDVTGGVDFLDGQSPSFTAPNTVSTLRFELTVTDELGARSQASLVQINVMEDPGAAFFVSPLGNDLNVGSRASPVRTITRALTLAGSAGTGADVYVVNGTYDGTLDLTSGTSIYGGFHSGTWLRDPEAAQVTIQGGVQGVAVRGANVSDITLDGLIIRTHHEAVATGQSLYGVFLSNAQSINITNNTIVSGDALGGSGGQFGFAGAPGLRGVDGANAACPSPGVGGAGGLPQTPNAGSQLGPAGGAGGDGGPVGVGGQSGSAGTGTGAGIAGQGGGAGAATGGTGAPGGDGTRGTDGADGVGATEGITLDAGGYAPRRGTDGTPGTSGSSGGGGGGGGGSATGAGGGGGGGGAAGGGGNPGQGGHGAGGSFPILVMTSTDVAVLGNTLIAGDGGIGGPGGPGGNGGIYGAPGVGGGGCNGGGTGGTGGHGGAGGNGGDGGGGAGGPSIGILADALSTISVAFNTMILGTPGAGGFSQGGLGAQGAAGIAAETYVLP